MHLFALCSSASADVTSSNRTLAVSMSAAALLLAATAHAQVAPPLTTNEGPRRQEERARERQRALQPRMDVLKPGGVSGAIPDLSDEQPCFVVFDIALTGPDARRFAWLQQSMQLSAGRVESVRMVDAGHYDAGTGEPQDTSVINGPRSCAGKHQGGAA